MDPSSQPPPSAAAALPPPPNTGPSPLDHTSPGGTLPFLPTTTSTITKFRNFTRMLTGQMSPQGQVAYWADVDARYEAMHCARCEAHRDTLLASSPIIRYLGDNIEKLGGRLDASNIRCRRCGPHELMMGGFNPHFGIKLCANVLSDKGRKGVEDTMAHEMVHAWDHLRWKVNWECEGGDLRGVACSEVGYY